MLAKLLIVGAVAALLVGCREQPAAHPPEQPATIVSAKQAVGAAQPCRDALTVLLRHSSLASGFKQTLWAEVEAQDESQLTLRLHTATTGEAGPAAVVGWVRLRLAERQLLDLTNDDEQPELLTFRRGDWDRAVACVRPEPTATVTFTDVFPEETVIAFAPAALRGPNPDAAQRAFGQRLTAYEAQHPSPADFDPDNLRQLINHETFSNREAYVHSGWLAYFLGRYRVQVREQTDLFEQAIAQEDAGAIAVLLDQGYVVAARQLRVAATTKARSDAARERNQHHHGLDERGDPLFYDESKSTIRAIQDQLKEHYGATTVADPDGYVNVRERPGTAAAVVGRVANGETIAVLDNTGPWWHIETGTGTQGFVFASRVALRPR